MFLGSNHNNPIAKSGLFITAVRLLLTRSEKHIQKERKKSGEFLGDPWIPESHSLRRQAEKLELCDENLDAMKAIITHIFSDLDAIPEMKSASFLETQKTELLNYLQQISAIPRKSYFDYPLYAIPGYLDYFKP